MTLAEYVKQIIKEKGLKVHEIQTKSGGLISDSYIQDIISGKTKSPSVDKLKGLAKGLEVDYWELLNVASGFPRERGWTTQTLIDAIVKIGRDDQLTEAVKLLLQMNRDEIGRLVSRLKKRKR